MLQIERENTRSHSQELALEEVMELMDHTLKKTIQAEQRYVFTNYYIYITLQVSV